MGNLFYNPPLNLSESPPTLSNSTTAASDEWKETSLLINEDEFKKLLEANRNWLVFDGTCIVRSLSNNAEFRKFLCAVVDKLIWLYDRSSYTINDLTFDSKYQSFSTFELIKLLQKYRQQSYPHTINQIVVGGTLLIGQKAAVQWGFKNCSFDLHYFPYPITDINLRDYIEYPVHLSFAKILMEMEKNSSLETCLWLQNIRYWRSTQGKLYSQVNRDFKLYDVVKYDQQQYRPRAVTLNQDAIYIFVTLRVFHDAYISRYLYSMIESLKFLISKHIVKQPNHPFYFCVMDNSVASTVQETLFADTFPPHLRRLCGGPFDFGALGVYYHNKFTFYEGLYRPFDYCWEEREIKNKHYSQRAFYLNPIIRRSFNEVLHWLVPHLHSFGFELDSKALEQTVTQLDIDNRFNLVSQYEELICYYSGVTHFTNLIDTPRGHYISPLNKKDSIELNHMDYLLPPFVSFLEMDWSSLQKLIPSLNERLSVARKVKQEFYTKQCQDEPTLIISKRNVNERTISRKAENKRKIEDDWKSLARWCDTLAMTDCIVINDILSNHFPSQVLALNAYAFTYFAGELSLFYSHLSNTWFIATQLFGYDNTDSASCGKGYAGEVRVHLFGPSIMNPNHQILTNCTNHLRYLYLDEEKKHVASHVQLRDLIIPIERSDEDWYEERGVSLSQGIKRIKKKEILLALASDNSIKQGSSFFLQNSELIEKVNSESKDNTHLHYDCIVKVNHWYVGSTDMVCFDEDGGPLIEHHVNENNNNGQSCDYHPSNNPVYKLLAAIIANNAQLLSNDGLPTNNHSVFCLPKPNNQPHLWNKNDEAC